MLVACPVLDASAIVRTGRKRVGGVVVGDHEQERRHSEADQPAEPEVGDADGVGARVGQAEAKRVAHEPVGDRVERRGGDHRRNREPDVQGELDVAGAGANRERPDDRGDDRDSAERERVDGDLARVLAREGQHP